MTSLDQMPTSAPPALAAPAASAAPRATERALLPRLFFGIISIAIVLAAALFTLHPSGIAMNDSGGYEGMLRYFMHTGALDYMRWCQPTFAGLLPIAVPWAALFGSSTDSLNLLGVLYMVLLAAGVYALAIRRISPAWACLLTLALLAFAEVVFSGPAFMTDVPYVAYAACFIAFFDRLLPQPLADHTAPQSRWLISSLAILFFALAVATRPFLAVVTPVFLLIAFIRPAQRRFWLTWFAATTIVLLAVLAIVAAISINRFTTLEQTVLRELAHHEWARLEIRTMAVSLLYTAILAFPLLLAIPAVRRPFFRRSDVIAIAVGLAGGALAFHFYRKGVLQEASLFPDLTLAHPKILWLEILLAPFALAALTRAIFFAAKTSLGLILAALILAQFAAMPIMPHPMVRHAMPAFVALLSMCALFASAPRWQIAATAAFVLLLAGYNSANAAAARANEAALWHKANDMVAHGTPPDQIFAGWAWFCEFQLHPGQKNPPDYVQRYHDLREHAQFVLAP